MGTRYSIGRKSIGSSVLHINEIGVNLTVGMVVNPKSNFS